MKVKEGKEPREDAVFWSRMVDRQGLGWPGAGMMAVFVESHYLEF